MIDHRIMALVCTFLDEVGGRVITVVDPAPTGHEHKRAIVGCVLAILVELGLCLGVRLIDDHRAKIIG